MDASSRHPPSHLQRFAPYDDEFCRLSNAMLWPRTSRLRSAKDAHALPQKQCFFCHETSAVIARSVAQDLLKGGEGSEVGKGSSQREATRTLSSLNSLQISLGTLDDWTCAHCGCRNLRAEGEPRGMASWDDSMAGATIGDEPNRATFAHLPTSKSLTRIGGEDTHQDEQLEHGNRPGKHQNEALDSPTPSLFCRRCMTNQQIQVSLLGEYEPAALGPDAAQAPSFSTYRDDLETRYPVLCDDCRPRVEAEIGRRNDLARRDVWRARMERDPPSRKASTTAVGARMMSERQQRPKTFDKNVRARTRSACDRWLEDARRVVTVTSDILHLPVLMSSSVFIVADLASTSDTGLSARWLNAVPLISLLPAHDKMWQPFAIVNGVLMAISAANSRGLCTQANSEDDTLDADWGQSGTDAGGAPSCKHDSGSGTLPACLYTPAHGLSLLAFVWSQYRYDCQDAADDARRRPLSGIALFLQNHPIVITSILWVFAVVQVLSTLVLVWAAIRQAWVPGRSSPSIQPASLQQDGKHNAYDLFVPGVADALGTTATTAGHAEEFPRRREPTPMDWQPTPDSTSSAANSGIALAPQRFYPPEAPTGLEGLMDRGLTLREDEGRDDKSRANGNARENKLFCVIGLLGGMVIILGLVLAVVFAQTSREGLRLGLAPGELWRRGV